MKQKKTWIVLATSQSVRIAANDGPGKGLYGISTEGLSAPPVAQMSDAPGMTKAPAGPDRGSISETDLKGQAAGAFAADIVQYLSAAHAMGAFHQLVLFAGPTMLGLLRQRMTPELSSVLRADIATDLTHLPLDELPAHLADVLVI